MLLRMNGTILSGQLFLLTNEHVGKIKELKISNSGSILLFPRQKTKALFIKISIAT